jgi:hypothetical protein
MTMGWPARLIEGPHLAIARQDASIAYKTYYQGWLVRLLLGVLELSYCFLLLSIANTLLLHVRVGQLVAANVSSNLEFKYLGS